jgi:hypothetical protein
MTPAEKDLIIKLNSKGKTPDEISAEIGKHRKKHTGSQQKKFQKAPDVGSIRRFLRGATHKSGGVETRGRPSDLTRANALHMNTVRKNLIKKSMLGKKPRYVKWDEIVKKSRVGPVHRTTAANAFTRENLSVKWRPLRRKPQRTKEHKAERKLLCGRLKNKKETYFTEDVDLIIDNKMWEGPTTDEARQYQAQMEVRGQIRTPSEGLAPGFTKPSERRHRKNLGCHVHLCTEEGIRAPNR